MNFFRNLKSEIEKVIEDLGEEGLVPGGLDCGQVSCEPPREAAHGDVSTNAALVLAKPAGLKPRELAAMLAARLEAHHGMARVVVAGPGFINMTLDREFWLGRLRDVLAAGLAYGDSDIGAGRPVNVEYVSANPTGPMHVGHARGAVVGDALAALLGKAGFAVTREYYVNDAGAQVDALARSVHLRYREALGEEIGEIPEGLYPGEYLKEVGWAVAEGDGRKWLGVEEGVWLAPVRAFATDAMMALIREDLAALGVTHDVFTWERELVKKGAVDEAFARLQEKGLIYEGVLEPPKGMKPEDWEPRPQTLFRSTAFGDDVDRPLRTSDGSWAYFATDIAYHLDKVRRGFSAMIDVWGADHGGYVKRMRAAVAALTDGKAVLDVKLCQLVHLLDAGEPVKMSKRAGTFVTLSEVVEEVGKDVVRFIMLTRSNDAALDFDLRKVTEQTRDNPVFYVQYAHARACSVFRNAGEELGLDSREGPPELPYAYTRVALPGDGAGFLSRLTREDEIALIRKLAAWPRQVESAAEAHEPHRIVYYLVDLAAEFHNWWNQGNTDSNLRVVVPEDVELSLARLALVRGVALVIASGLAVLGVEPVEEMR